jgi:hypothetical protein
MLMVLTAGACTEMWRALTAAPALSSDNGEAREGSLQRVPPRLGGGAAAEAEPGERGEGGEVLEPHVRHVGAVVEVEACERCEAAQLPQPRVRDVGEAPEVERGERGEGGELSQPRIRDGAVAEVERGERREVVQLQHHHLRHTPRTAPESHPSIPSTLSNSSSGSRPHGPSSGSVAMEEESQWVGRCSPETPAEL